MGPIQSNCSVPPIPPIPPIDATQPDSRTFVLHPPPCPEPTFFRAADSSAFTKFEFTPSRVRLGTVGANHVSMACSYLGEDLDLFEGEDEEEEPLTQPQSSTAGGWAASKGAQTPANTPTGEVSSGARAQARASTQRLRKGPRPARR